MISIPVMPEEQNKNIISGDIMLGDLFSLTWKDIRNDADVAKDMNDIGEAEFSVVREQKLLQA